MEPKIQDLAIHTSTMKGMWNYLEELYSEKNDLNRALDVIQEMFWSKAIKSYFNTVDFNRVYEELKVLFPISQDAKKLQKQWDRLVMLSFLGSLPSWYTPVSSQAIRIH